MTGFGRIKVQKLMISERLCFPRACGIVGDVVVYKLSKIGVQRRKAAFLVVLAVFLFFRPGRHLCAQLLQVFSFSSSVEPNCAAGKKRNILPNLP